MTQKQKPQTSPQKAETVEVTAKEQPQGRPQRAETVELTAEELKRIAGGLNNAPNGITPKTPKPTNFSGTMMEGSNM